MLGKYLWHVCNKTKSGFAEPIYGAKIDEEVSLSYVFFPQSPQHLYFKKPVWMNELLVAKDEKEVNQLAHQYDYFVNQYRYRGAHPPETNAGYSDDLQELNLYVPPITFKAVYEESLYIDDLLLEDKYAEFLEAIRYEIAPNGAPIIVLHNRAYDRWMRHQSFALMKYDKLLTKLLKRFPHHIFVLVGEAWHTYQHPRIKNLASYINRDRCHKSLKEYTAALQFILSAYFCRDAEMVFIGISGFTLFVESIRPLTKCPPIPVFWQPEVFSGQCTCVQYLEKTQGWNCPEYEAYKQKVPHDAAYQYGLHHFLYYSRDELQLMPYCYNTPVTIKKTIKLTKALATKWDIPYSTSIIRKNDSIWLLGIYRLQASLPILLRQIKLTCIEILMRFGRTKFGSKIKHLFFRFIKKSRQMFL